ncbi:MAG: amidohydrolase, partial [Gammaproteobacteria bacterium]
RALGAAHVIEGKPLIGTDETVEFSKAYTPAVPMLFFYVGSSAPKALDATRAGGAALPSLHAPEYAPDADASLRTGALALIGAARELLPP